ncbi:hypothetical protein RIR_jg38432.t1 [Rhizophagus irregularis DAOM 181602=DAOM 197198]|nr:hypothetical protein RIR_jg38432.t1 [Rhizophagus irregularis DAOM 181602=DAOM 197198]
MLMLLKIIVFMICNCIKRTNWNHIKFKSEINISLNETSSYLYQLQDLNYYQVTLGLNLDDSYQPIKNSSTSDYIDTKIKKVKIWYYHRSIHTNGNNVDIGNINKITYYTCYILFGRLLLLLQYLTLRIIIIFIKSFLSTGSWERYIQSYTGLN